MVESTLDEHKIRFIRGKLLFALFWLGVFFQLFALFNLDLYTQRTQMDAGRTMQFTAHIMNFRERLRLNKGRLKQARSSLEK